MSYGWIIDTDHIRSESEPEGTNSNAKGVCGPGDGIDPAKVNWQEIYNSLHGGEQR